MEESTNKHTLRNTIILLASVATIIMLFITIQATYFPQTKGETTYPNKIEKSVDSTAFGNEYHEYAGTLDIQNRTNSSRLFSFRRLNIDQFGNEVWAAWENRTIARLSGKLIDFNNRIEIKLSMKNKDPMIYSFIVSDYHCVEFEWNEYADRWQLVPCENIDLFE